MLLLLYQRCLHYSGQVRVLVRPSIRSHAESDMSLQVAMRYRQRGRHSQLTDSEKHGPQWGFGCSSSWAHGRTVKYAAAMRCSRDFNSVCCTHHGHGVSYSGSENPGYFDLLGRRNGKGERHKPFSGKPGAFLPCRQLAVHQVGRSLRWTRSRLPRFVMTAHICYVTSQSQQW